MADEHPLETGWLPATPIDDNLLRRFVLNQAAMVAAVAHSSDGRVESDDEVALSDAASVVPFFNHAVLLRPLQGADDPLLDRVSAFYGRDRAPWTLLSVWPTPDLSARGWSLMGHPAFVVRAPTTTADRAIPADVTVEVVTDTERLALAERVAVEGYPLEAAIGGPVGAAMPPAMLDSDVSCRLGMLDGEAVAVGLGHVSHGVVNLCLGATLPAARRRGVWEALVWARISDGPDLPTVAFTSDHSRPGFERMGFLPITRFTLWLST